MTGQAAAAPDPDERLEDPALEARAREVGRELRCVVCQSQSIEESDAPLAEDLRRLVRERIAAGESNAEVLDYVADRYGDYVLLRPPVRGSTFILWGAPAGLILLAGAAGIIFLRRKETGAPTLAEGEAVIGEQKSGEPVAGENGLTEDERRRLAELELRARDA
ncbi:MAG: cytochrome c-type biogenesis protein CcmH [Alphaproteobacteria bacterium]|nr:cytochrome c-type biogenesis protein CcmH [Alphaproteobacteria bacterium]